MTYRKMEGRVLILVTGTGQELDVCW